MIEFVEISALFAVTALAEIVGCHLPRLVLEKGRSAWLLLLVALHLAAIAFYFFAKRDNLVKPMLTGDKSGIDAPAAADDRATRLRAALLLALAVGLVGYVVNL